MKRDPKWMSLDEAIRHVMRAEKCSREEAWELLRAKLAAGKIPARAKHFVVLPLKDKGSLTSG